MKYLFSAYAVLSFIGGCTGAYHQFAISAICLAVTVVLWYEYRKKRKSGNRLTD